MRIPFTEPTSSRYIFINPDTNKVHLLVPVVSGQEISTDNTCKSTAALREFFDGGAERALNAHKNALEFYIALLEDNHPLRADKEARLAQIKTYIKAIPAMRFRYSDAITALMKKPSNLYSVQLRPRIQDPASNVVNPAFTVNRQNNTDGTPLSALYNAMHNSFPGIKIKTTKHNPRDKLVNAVLSALPAMPEFEDIQRILGERCLALFGLSIDFTQRADGTPVSKKTIATLMGYHGDEIPKDTTPQDYVDILLGACAQDIWGTIPTPPFYSIPMATPMDKRTEQLSILTQFFLAILTIYCKAKDISDQNFGMIMDNSPVLSHDLVRVVSRALSAGDDVESKIYDFCNTHAAEFGLSRSLNAEDLTAIRQKFERTYHTITATKENPHMDDFMILDTASTQESAKFVTHQGSICVNFAEIVESVLPNQGYFASIRTDFSRFRKHEFSKMQQMWLIGAIASSLSSLNSAYYASNLSIQWHQLAALEKKSAYSSEIPHKNEWLRCEVEVELETLLAHINDEQFEMLPKTVQKACRNHPSFQIRQFLHDVAKGKQDEAEALLTATPANTQTLLQTPGIFTDYSGRTFNCTAYEYAYWAKDSHMLRMLERYMDEETKAQMLVRIDEIEKTGLCYQQNGNEYRNAHFDFTPLKQALRNCVNIRDNLSTARNLPVLRAYAMVVGKAQRDVPAHVAQEYCRKDRSFEPLPEFNETILPRDLTFSNSLIKARYDYWYPLAPSNSGLGFDFAIKTWAKLPHETKPLLGAVASPMISKEVALSNLAAITRLDEVRTAELAQSREFLASSENSSRMRL